MADTSARQQSNSTARDGSAIQPVHIASRCHTALYCAGETERDWLSSERSHCDRGIWDLWSWWRDPSLYRLNGTLITRYRYRTDSTVGMVRVLLGPRWLFQIFSKHSLLSKLYLSFFILLLLLLLVRLTKDHREFNNRLDSGGNYDLTRLGWPLGLDSGDGCSIETGAL